MREINSYIREYAKNKELGPAIVWMEREVYFSELDDLASRAARWLSLRGIKRGDIVVIAVRDQIALLSLILGCMRSGVVPFPTSPLTSELQMRALTQASGSAFLISDEPRTNREGSDYFIFAESKLPPRGEVFDEKGVRGDEICLLLGGSGTTGAPRLIPMHWSALFGRLEIGKKIYKTNSNKKIMPCSSLHFAMALRPIFTTLYAGSTGVLSAQNGSLGQEIMSIAPDVLLLGVYHAERIIQESILDHSVNLSNIKMVLIGASSVSVGLRQRMKNIGAKVFVEYGANECSTISISDLQEVGFDYAGVGRPPEGVEVEIVDIGGSAVVVGAVGHLRVKSPAQISRYLNSDIGERFRDGWFYPGDLAMWSEDGQLFHCGRADQMMIMNGINIYPAEIERILEQHPTVRDVVAFPLKHPIAQDIPACAVVLDPGATSSRADLTAFARERLGARAPRFIAILDEIPRNDQGKPKRPELMRLVGEQLASQAKASSPPPVSVSAGHLQKKPVDGGR